VPSPCSIQISLLADPAASALEVDAQDLFASRPLSGRMTTKARREQTTAKASRVIVSPRGPQYMPLRSLIHTSMAFAPARVVSTV